MIRTIIISCFFVFTLACGSSDAEGPEAEPTERCDSCGMRVSPDDGWRAGADGVSFDAPKCLFRHAHRHGSLTDPWVIEYYTQERREASAMLYVVGTDLQSPMGVDLVPVEGREAAERMQTDHGGDRILTYDEVSAELVESLFR